MEKAAENVAGGRRAWSLYVQACSWPEIGKYASQQGAPKTAWGVSRKLEEQGDAFNFNLFFLGMLSNEK